MVGSALLTNTHFNLPHHDVTLRCAGQGIGYHESRKEYPKTKFRLAQRLNNIPLDRLLNDDFLYLLAQLKVCWGNPGNGPHSIYEVLLPYLVGGSLKDAMRAVEDDEHGDFWSPQRAGTCYHRCVIVVTRYLLKRLKFSVPKQKQVAYAVRVGYLDCIIDDMKKVDSLHDSARTIISLSCRMTAAAAVKQYKRGHMSVENLEAIQSKV